MPASGKRLKVAHARAETPEAIGAGTPGGVGSTAVQQGDFNSRFRRLVSFVTGVGAVLLALVLMAVADGNGVPVAGPPVFGRSGPGTTVTDPPEVTPVAQPSTPSPAPAPVALASGGTTVPTPATELAAVIVTPSAPARPTTTTVAPPPTVAAPQSRKPAPKPVPTGTPTPPPPPPHGGGGHKGGGCGKVVRYGPHARGVRPGPCRRGDPPSRSGGPHPHPDIPAKCRPR